MLSVGGGGLGFGRAGDGAWFGVKNMLQHALRDGNRGGKGHPHRKRNFIRKNLPPGMDGMHPPHHRGNASNQHRRGNGTNPHGAINPIALEKKLDHLEAVEEKIRNIIAHRGDAHHTAANTNSTISLPHGNVNSTIDGGSTTGKGRVDVHVIIDEH